MKKPGFKKLFREMEKSPAYWLEGVIIGIGEYKCELERIPVRTKDVTHELRGVRKCYAIAKYEMRLYENYKKCKPKS